MLNNKNKKNFEIFYSFFICSMKNILKLLVSFADHIPPKLAPPQPTMTVAGQLHFIASLIR